MIIYDALHRNKVSICVVFVIVSVPSLITSVISLLYSNGKTGLIKVCYDLIGSWAYWLILISIMLLAIGLFYFIDFVKKLREFKELVDTPSKAKFIQNLDRIEELAWRLHPKYEKMVIDKKNKHNIK